ncbi:MAG: hypothetical protein JNL10_21380 [Verrucomicrobiales bacterium]|nr:hypothetical protein [Verrucomicrobiales bacterium]
MASPARVQSIEAIDAFRASLVTYLETARPTLDDIGAEVMRTRIWLEQDRLRYWERELERRRRLLDEAEDALRSARMSQFREATDAEAMAVRKARAAFEAADVRLRQVRRWCRDFDSRISPLAHQLESLRTMLTTDLPRAVASLTRRLDILTDYAGTALSPSDPPPEAPPREPDAGGAP